MGDVTKKDKKIKVNKIRCKLCGDVIISDNRHDMKWCKCGACAVDGGTEYLKRAWDPKVFEEAGVSRPTQNSITKPQGIFFEELTEYEEDET